MHEVSRMPSALRVAWEADDRDPAAVRDVVSALAAPGDRVETVGEGAAGLWPPSGTTAGDPGGRGDHADLVVVAGASPSDLDHARARVRRGGRVAVVATNATHADGRGAHDPAAVTLDGLDGVLRSAGLVRVRLHRILVPVARGEVDDAVLRRPDAETRTFVALAVRDDGDAAVAGLAAEVDALQAAVVQERAHHALDRAAWCDQVADLQDELGSRGQRIAELERQVADLEQHVEAILSTLTFRAVAPLRALYGRLRAR